MARQVSGKIEHIEIHIGRDRRAYAIHEPLCMLLPVALNERLNAKPVIYYAFLLILRSYL